MNQNRLNLYLAAPLFSDLERMHNQRLRNRLASIVDVYLPQEDGRLIFDLIKAGIPVDAAKQQIFENDIAAMHRCNVLLIILDGRTVDEGACFELGYAYAFGKLCVGLKTDVRSLLPFGDNPMIECALQKIFSDEDALINWLDGSPEYVLRRSGAVHAYE